MGDIAMKQRPRSWRFIAAGLATLVTFAAVVADSNTDPAWATNSSNAKKNWGPNAVLLTDDQINQLLLVQNRYGLSDAAMSFIIDTSYGRDVGADQEQVRNFPENLNLPGVKSHLGMYVSGDNNFNSWGAGGGGSLTHGSGFGATDSAGVLAPGSVTPNFRGTSGGGGIFGTFDASYYVSAGQHLFFNGFFDYSQYSESVSAAVGLPALVIGAGSSHNDAYTFGGSVLYSVNTAYLQGTGAVSFGHGGETESFDGSTGNFGTSAYVADMKMGNVFVLLNTSNSGTKSVIPTKAPPKFTPGYIVALDLSGHIGYVDNQFGSFTDSSGFVYGTEEAKYTDLGGRAKLLAIIPSNGIWWQPYVAATLDQRLGFSHTLFDPAQAALPTGDLVNFQEANTFWGTELGVDARGAGGWTLGIKGFYEASADMNIAGGNITLKIPFNYTPTVASRY